MVFNTPEENTEIVEQEHKVVKKKLSYAKIFLWFGIGVLISGAVGYALPYLLVSFIPDLTQASNIWTILTIVAAVITFPLMIIISWNSFRKKTALMSVSYILYCISFGVLISSALAMVDIQTSLYALLATGGVMLLMGLFGILLGDRIGNVAMVVSALAMGAIIISLVNLFVFNETLYWIASFAMLAMVMLMVAIDMNFIKRTVDGCESINTSLAIFCAYHLYADFIYLFIRFLYIFGRRK